MTPADCYDFAKEGGGHQRPMFCERDVWTWIESGCNANEIAAYALVSVAAAYAMMARASRLFSEPAKKTVMRLAGSGDKLRSNQNTTQD